jgi:hypothetical protein
MRTSCMFIVLDVPGPRPWRSHHAMVAHASLCAGAGMLAV